MVIRQSCRKAEESASGTGVLGPDVLDGSGLHVMGNLLPQVPASLFQPLVQGLQRRESTALAAKAGGGRPGRSSRPVPSPSPKPDCRTQSRTDSDSPWPRTGIDLAILAAADPVNRRAHVVVNPAPGNPAQSCDQSNWRVSPGSNANGTNVPRPLVRICRWRSDFQARAKAVTRSYKPLQPRPIRSACNCLTMRFCLRGLFAFVRSQADIRSEYVSSRHDHQRNP
ncbi:hypothetical protein L598_003700000360 [Mesorhizobium sp. J18]|nr:hypothetical protein L598_003700000360 [Mesorhizobium sp. J18]